jgi:hypothetical protein
MRNASRQSHKLNTYDKTNAMSKNITSIYLVFGLKMIGRVANDW